jgi:hypothetical protein
MIGMPRHLANDRLDGVRTADVMPDVDGWDLAAVAANVTRQGGDDTRFAMQLAAALAAAGSEVTDPDLVRTAVALAAWRAGVLALRDDGLARLRALLASTDASSALGGTAVDVAGAALGLAPESLAEFTERQVTDRFWWPGRERWSGYVCAVGGFTGLGGAWLEPPADGRTFAVAADAVSNGAPVAGPAVFGVRTGATWWRIDADVWGARLTATGGEPASVAPAPNPRVTVVTRPDSYLAWLHVGGGS